MVTRYDPNSIVDTLSSKGQASDYGSRAKLAASLGITGYTGTGEQNTDLIKRYTSNKTVTTPIDKTTTDTTTTDTTPEEKKKKTTTTAPVVRYTNPYDTAATDYYTKLKKDFTASDENIIRENKRKQVQDQLDAINALGDINLKTTIAENKQNTGRTRSILSSAGLQGSGRGLAKTTQTENFNKDQIASVEAQRQAKIAALLAGVEDRASEEIAAKRKEAQGNQEAYLTFLKNNVDKSKETVKNFAALGVTQDQLDPQDIEDLMKHTGYNKLELDALWNSNLPDNMKTQYQTVTAPDANGKAKVTRVGYNPVTKKTEKQEYTLDIPYDQIANKELKEVDGVLYSVDAKTGTAKALTQMSEKKQLELQKLRNEVNGGGNSSATDKAQKKAELLTLIGELKDNATKGKQSAIGASAAKFVPFGKSLGLQGDRTAFESKLETLKSNLTLDNLKLLKGTMTDKDLVFLNSIGSSLDTNMSEESFNAELQRLENKISGAKINTPTGKTNIITAPDGTQVEIVD